MSVRASFSCTSGKSSASSAWKRSNFSGSRTLACDVVSHRIMAESFSA